MSATNGETSTRTDADEPLLQAAMDHELESGWRLILACLGNDVPRNVLQIAHSSYWIGVRTGVRVNSEAVGRAYQ